MTRKNTYKAPSHERWLVSYADFVTMIFALFVVLFASARSDRARQADMAAAMKAAFSELGIFPPESKTPALIPARALSATNPLPLVSAEDDSAQFEGSAAQRANLLALKRSLETALAPEIRRQIVALRLTRDGLVVSLMEVGFFDSGSAALKPASAPTIRKLMKQLRNAPNDLRIEGHTDDVPIHSALFASNWELSTARAVTLAKLLIGTYGYDPSKLSAAGYAQYHPAAPNTDAAGRARNRRVDLVILPAAIPASRAQSAARPG